MCCERETGAVMSEANWLAELSMQARISGDCERADRLLLLAWQAYDGQTISPTELQQEGSGGGRAGETTVEPGGITRAMGEFGSSSDQAALELDLSA
jgi:hypothetical protein